MTERKFSTTKLSKVMSYKAYLVLDDLLQADQSGQRYQISTVTYWPNSKGSNLLTAVVVKYLRLTGAHAERVNTQGQLRKGRHGEYKWAYSTSMAGSADIHAIIDGRYVGIEIKYGRDKQSDVQEKYQAKVEQAGGTYIICKLLDDVIELKI